MAVKHLVVVDSFPFTRCGVDITVKLGVDWTDDPDDGITCKNCMKLMAGLSMGASSANIEEREALAIAEEEVRIATKLERVEAYDRRLRSLLLDSRDFVGRAETGEEKGEWVAMQEYLEAAIHKLTMAVIWVKNPEGKVSTNDAAD